MADEIILIFHQPNFWSNYMLMILACLTMLIDHIGAIFFPNIQLLRIIGRFSMPIYSYFIYCGFKYTKDLKKYCISILKISLFSQIPFSIFSQSLTLNICFMWIAALIILYCIKNKKIPAALLIIILSIILPSDYGIYAILWVVFFFIFNINSKCRIIAIFMILTATVLYIKLLHIPYYQFLSVFSILPIIYFGKTGKARLTDKRFKYVYHYFYPVNLIIIDIIWMLQK